MIGRCNFIRNGPDAMSFDIRILCGRDPYSAERTVPVSRIIELIDSYPPFVKRGISWSNQRFIDTRPWRGLCMELFNDVRAPDERDDEALADGLNLYIPYGSDSDMLACFKVAEFVAEAIGAAVWDMQTEKPL